MIAEKYRSYLTIDQAAELAQVCRNTIKRALREMELPYLRLGRLVRIKRSDFDDWMEQKIAGGRRSQQRSGVATVSNQVIEKATGGRQ